MAVITRYVVVRNGEELAPVFSVKKEAEAYDRMLDAADELARFIKAGELEMDIDDAVIDAVAILLAKKGPEVVKILKGIKPVLPPSEADAGPAEEPPAAGGEKKGTRGPSRKGGSKAR